MNVFVYGTLLFPEVRQRIVTLNQTGEPATLFGFQRFEARTRSRGNYPAVVRCENASVDGLVFRNVDSTQCARLDEFEAVSIGLYSRQEASVVLEGKPIAVQVYVAGPALLERLLEPMTRSWSPVLFQQQELQWYVQHEL